MSFKFIRFQSNQRLISVQKTCLLIYIKRLNDMNISSTFKFIVKIANYILQRDDVLTIFINKN